MNTMISSVAFLAIAGNLAMAGGDIAPVEPVVSEVVVSDGWKYDAAIYVWGAGIEGEAANGAPIDMSFSDILDNLDFTFMGNFGAQKDKWTLRTDVIYLKVGDKPDVYLPPIDATLTNIQLKSWVVTPTVAYSITESEKLDLDVVAGLRYLYMKPTLGINGSDMSDSDSVTDGIVGLRGQYDMNEKWSMPFQIDVGAGDSDVTWQAFAGVGYAYENFDLIAGYRHMEWDFDTGVPLKDLSMSGPIIGAKYRF